MNTNWASDLPLDTWHGVITDAGGNVTGLDLRSNGLTGTIPAAIILLERLDTLILIGKRITGEIPPGLGHLRQLRCLDLGFNALAGPIPHELGNLTELEELFLYGNALTGPIPSELGNLRNLPVMDLRWNALTGPIPSELLGNLQGLRILGLEEENDLTGPIPPELGNLRNLAVLSLESNALSGPIPSEQQPDRTHSARSRPAHRTRGSAFGEQQPDGWDPARSRQSEPAHRPGSREHPIERQATGRIDRGPSRLLPLVRISVRPPTRRFSGGWGRSGTTSETPSVPTPPRRR